MKFKKLLAVTLLAALALLATACPKSPIDHYPTFTKVMDKLFGPGNWSAKSHAAGPEDSLTVSGLTIKLPGLNLPAASGQPAAPAPAREMEIAAIEIKKPLEPAKADALLAAADWRNQKEAALAAGLVAKGLVQRVPLGPETFEFTVAEVAVESIALAASGSDAPAGLPGFLKALQVASLTYKDFGMKSRQNGADFNYKVSLSTLNGLTFGGEPLKAFDALDPSGLTSMATATSVKYASMKDIVMEMADPAKKSKGRLSLDLVEEKEVNGVGSIGEFTAAGFKFQITDEEQALTSTFNLDKVLLRGFDFSAYLKRMVPLILASATNPDVAEKMVGEMFKLGDIFVAPFSLDELAISGLEFNLNDFLKVKLASASATGPYRAGEIPAAQKSSINGLEVILPGAAPKSADGPEQDLFEFGQKFGLTDFRLDAESEGAYDPATGSFTSRTTRLEVKDLLKMTGSLEIIGLTPDQVNTLKQTNLDLAPVALMTSDVAVKGLNLKIEDLGLVERAFNYAAQVGQSGQKPEKLRQQTVLSVKMLVGAAKDVLANPEVAAKSLADFLQKPASLELRLAAEPPLGAKSVMAMGGDKNKILDSLNITLSANGETAPTLKFNLAD